jgi:hypothetical protein
LAGITQIFACKQSQQESNLYVWVTSIMETRFISYSKRTKEQFTIVKQIYITKNASISANLQQHQSRRQRACG